MKILLTFLVGVLAGVAAHWYFAQPKSQDTVTDIKESVQRNSTQLQETLKDTFNAQTIKEELERESGKVIREKTRQAGHAVADATADARISASIKAKLLKESALSALKIDVNTTDGVVTLSGTVPLHEDIEKATNLALETEGVHKVISTLQIRPK